jgi:hypothetical protein
MTNNTTLEAMLTGGHPNSLGNTVAVVHSVLTDKYKLEELYQCYFSDDAVVRLRVSNAMKRICKEHPDWLIPYIDRFLTDISKIEQASTKWTLAQLFLWLCDSMTKPQLKQAKSILKTNLDNTNDWIVQNTTIETLAFWAREDEELKHWLLPRLEKLEKSDKKSVAGRAKKC